MHLAPSQTQGSGVAQPKHPSLPPEFLEQWHRGNQINGDQNMALSMQVQQLANQVQIMAGMMAGSMQPGHQQGSNRSVNWPRDPGSPPGSGSSSSSDSNRKRGGGRGQGPPSNQSPLGDGGSPSNGSNPSSSDSEDPYKKEKRLMRIKQYDGMKLPALPQDAAKCRNFRNAVFSTVCKFAKNDESEVFRWINRCNLSDDGKEFSKSNDFPILDRILGAKVLELAKSTKFALEFQTHQERCQASNQQPKGRTLLWLIFQKYKLDRDRGTALSQHHLLSLKMNGNDIKALEDFRQRYDFCVGALEVRDMPSESSLRSLLFESLKNHPKMALSIDKFREASSGSSKRTSKWLYTKMCEAFTSQEDDEHLKDLPRIQFTFNRRGMGRLRQMVDLINDELGDD